MRWFPQEQYFDLGRPMGQNTKRRSDMRETKDRETSKRVTSRGFLAYHICPAIRSEIVTNREPGLSAPALPSTSSTRLTD